MQQKVPERISRLVDSVLRGSGVTSRAQRKTIFAAAAALSESPVGVELEPQELSRLVNKVARYAYRVTDEDFEALRRRGLSDDAVFESVICAAVGAGHARLLRGLEVLEKALP